MILDKSVYDDFEAAISEREAQNQKVDFTFVGLNNVELKSAEYDGKNEVITVEYNAQVISVTRDADGEIVDGDPTEIMDIADEWTYARPVKSRDPNWKLVSTNQLS
jgi:predicted lipid-binding transport protein (Tim44 family)